MVPASQDTKICLVGKTGIKQQVLAIVLMLLSNKEGGYQKEIWIFVMDREHRCVQTETSMGFLRKFLATSSELFYNNPTERVPNQTWKGQYIQFKRGSRAQWDQTAWPGHTTALLPSLYKLRFPHMNEGDNNCTSGTGCHEAFRLYRKHFKRHLLRKAFNIYTAANEVERLEHLKKRRPSKHPLLKRGLS